MEPRAEKATAGTKGAEEKKKGAVKAEVRKQGAVCKGDCDGNVIREVQCVAFGGGGAESVQEAPSASNLG